MAKVLKVSLTVWDLTTNTARDLFASMEEGKPVSDLLVALVRALGHPEIDNKGNKINYDLRLAHAPDRWLNAASPIKDVGLLNGMTLLIAPAGGAVPNGVPSASGQAENSLYTLTPLVRK